ncbi:MAG: class A beta-lactamase-related serine hydrolase [Gaiella sp.]|nr:class A beta-lactamase-related serine hydrolase [Gaiella sp.]
MIDTPPPAASALPPPVIERPAAYEVSYGIVAGRAARGAERVIVRIDGKVARKLRLTQRVFRLDVDLPPREVEVRVETVDAAGRRAGRTVAHVFGLPRSARPRLRLLRPDVRLQAAVGRLAGGFSGTAGAYLENLGTGAGAAWNARATFPAASTLKLAIAVSVLTRTQSPPARGSSLDRLIRTMLDASDNESANRLLIGLGGSTSAGGHLVDAVMRSIGLERTVMYGGYVLGTSLASDRGIAARGVPLGVLEQPAWGVGKATTALDLARLHRAVWLASGGLGPLVHGRSGVSPAEARYLLYVLAHVGDGRKLGRFVGARPGLVVLHKAGWIDPARHDAGIVVWRGGIFVAAVMTYDGGGAGTRSDVFAGRVALAALRAFSG